MITDFERKSKAYLFTFLLVVLPLSAFVLLQVFKGATRDFAFLDNIVYTPALLAWLFFISRDVSGSFSKRMFWAGGALLVAGDFSNILVSIVNGGGFPIYGYSQEEFILIAPRMYHFIADKSTPLYMLGDLRIFDGHSAGDLMIFLGLLLVTISLLPFIFKKVGEMLE